MTEGLPNISRTSKPGLALSLVAGALSLGCASAQVGSPQTPEQLAHVQKGLITDCRLGCVNAGMDHLDTSLDAIADTVRAAHVGDRVHIPSLPVVFQSVDSLVSRCYAACQTCALRSIDQDSVLECVREAMKEEE